MSIEDDLRSVLANPTETPNLDFKVSVGWSSLRSQIELARDVVCLANRNGGLLVLGVQDLGGGRWKPVGLSSDDPMPDPTELGKVLRKYFDPSPSFTVREGSIDGGRYGVVQVDEFARTPIICKAIGNDELNHAVVRPGYFYRRSDAMECAAIESASGVQSVIESAVAKTGAAIRVMVGAGPAENAPSHTVESASDETLRFCDLVPFERSPEVAIPEILARISAAVVRSYGGIIIPRSIDPQTLPPSAIVREPGRVIIERTREDSDGRTSSLIEVSRALTVRLREGLWESAGAMDFTALFAFVLGSLLFARRFYDGTSIATVAVHVGLTHPLGRHLVDDPSKFTGFNQFYVSTSGVDLVVSRTLTMAQLNDVDQRVAAGRAILDELFAYFGFVLNDGAFEAHLAHIKANLAGVAS